MASWVYELTALPALGNWGSDPALTPDRMLATIDDDALRTLLEIVFLSDDLLQHQACLAGELTEPAPAVLTEAQVRNHEPLPEYLMHPADSPTKIPTDQLWTGYYHYAADGAHSLNNNFLIAWLTYEVALRNALAAQRASALGLNPDDYLVAAERITTDDNFSALINEWTAASTPLDGLEVLDRARWQWLGQRDAWFTFHADELLAYAAKLTLLIRWHRLRAENGDRPSIAVAYNSSNSAKR